MSQPPVFGRRNAPVTRSFAPVAVSPARLAPDHAAVFAAARREIGETEETRARTVPRSFRAAILAGLCTGFGLAGLDVTHASDTIRGIAVFGLDRTTQQQLVPVIVLLALLGGARAAATNLLVSHWVLRRMEITHHLAYAIGGGVVAAGLAALIAALGQTGLVDPDNLPTHGWMIDAGAGAAAGFLYRVFAGSQQASKA